MHLICATERRLRLDVELLDLVCAVAATSVNHEHDVHVPPVLSALVGSSATIHDVTLAVHWSITECRVVGIDFESMLLEHFSDERIHLLQGVLERSVVFE